MGRDHFAPPRPRPPRCSERHARVGCDPDVRVAVLDWRKRVSVWLASLGKGATVPAPRSSRPSSATLSLWFRSAGGKALRRRRASRATPRPFRLLSHVRGSGVADQIHFALLGFPRLRGRRSRCALGVPRRLFSLLSPRPSSSLQHRSNVCVFARYGTAARSPLRFCGCHGPRRGHLGTRSPSPLTVGPGAPLARDRTLVATCGASTNAVYCGACRSRQRRRHRRARTRCPAPTGRVGDSIARLPRVIITPRRCCGCAVIVAPPRLKRARCCAVLIVIAWRPVPPIRRVCPGRALPSNGTHCRGDSGGSDKPSAIALVQQYFRVPTSGSTQRHVIGVRSRGDEDIIAISAASSKPRPRHNPLAALILGGCGATLLACAAAAGGNAGRPERLANLV